MTDILEMRDIHKIYPNGTVANRGVNLTVREGEIHALVGENGAGKSTLMKILFGLEAPTKGKILYKGEKVQFSGPKDAISRGIGMVHQHFMLVPSFTVAENIVLGNEPKKGILIDRNQTKEIASKLAKEYGLAISPDTKVENLSVGKKQRVEILKVLYQGAKLLILDEPTAVLTPQETKDLFSSLKELVKKGFTIIFITHKLREVMEISDRITVLRAGTTVGTLKTSETNEEEISRLMVGRDVLLRVNKSKAHPKDVVLSVKNLIVNDDRGKEAVKGISFEVRAGEIFGIAGVEGNGQTELIEAITGLRKVKSGSIIYLNENLTELSVRQIRNKKVGHIPEDRQTRGACLTASIEENLILDNYRSKEFSAGPFIKEGIVREFAKKMIMQFDIRTKSSKFHASSLSGGNLQKVVVARELSKDPKLLIASQPTRGVDIGAIEFIHKEIVKKRDEGVAVLLVSAELQEVLSLSDRIGVIYNGEMVAIIDNHENLTEEEIGYYMLGLKRQEEVIKA
jgi:general nucleoside transport system ATP-binding protein